MSCSAIRIHALALVGALLFPLLAVAQPYPSRPIRIIVPFSAGSASDIIARTISVKLRGVIGQEVVVENRPGAIGTIGSAAAAKSAPDGYTITMGASGTHGSSVALFNKLPYDPVADFAPITLIGQIPFVLVVGSDAREKSVPELVASAKAAPGRRTLAAASGVSHLFGELFKITTGADLTIVPYKDLTGVFMDVGAGRVDGAFETLPAMLPQIKAGRVKVLAITSSKRSALLPDTPTVVETGYPGFEGNVWTAFFAPAGTPKPIVAKLHTSLVEVLQMPDVKDSLRQSGTEVLTSTPEELGDMVKAEIAKWNRVAEQAKLPKRD